MIVDATKRLRSPRGLNVVPRIRRLIRHPSGATRICVAVTSSATPAADRALRYLHASRYPIATSASALMRPETKSGSKGRGRSGLTTCSTIGSVLPNTCFTVRTTGVDVGDLVELGEQRTVGRQLDHVHVLLERTVPPQRRVPDAPDQPQFRAAAAYRLEQVGILDPDGVGPGPAAAGHGRKEDRQATRPRSSGRDRSRRGESRRTSCCRSQRR